MNEEKLLANLSLFKDTIQSDLTDEEVLMLVANICLDVSVKYLPKGLTEEPVRLVSNGRSVTYELMKHTESKGLNLALKAHHILGIASTLGGE